MSSKKFNEAEEKYKKTKKWTFISYMKEGASSYDDYKKIVQYIIDFGVYKPDMPENVGFYEREEQYLIKDKFNILVDSLIKYRELCKTEQQLIEYINLSLANDLWTAHHSYHIGKTPDTHAINDLKPLATTFEAYYLLYLYDYYNVETTASYLQKLEELATTTEQTKKIEDTMKLVKSKVEWLAELD